MFFSKLPLRVLIVAALIFATSCEVTRALWEDNYKESIRQFLVSKDGRYIVFLGKKYHYIFADQSGVIDELLRLDQDHVVLIVPEITELAVDGKNNIEGHLGIKTFDLNLTSEQRIFLFSLGFKQEKEQGDLMLKLPLKGKRYRGVESVNEYYSALEEKCEIEIHHQATPLRDLEKIALTPLTLVADTLFLSKEIVMAPFLE